MIEVRPIPVELEARRLADATGIGLAEARSFLETARPLIEPVGVFDEVKPGEILPPDLTELDWGPVVIVGLCVLASKRELTDERNGLWPTLLELAAGEALGFLEYRIRLFLKPTGRRPSERLVPGCPALPLPVNAAIMNHFQPDHTYGLNLLPDGRLGGANGTAFLYPTSGLVFRSKCEACTLKNCPSKPGLQS